MNEVIEGNVSLGVFEHEVIEMEGRYGLTSSLLMSHMATWNLTISPSHVSHMANTAVLDFLACNI